MPGHGTISRAGDVSGGECAGLAPSLERLDNDHVPAAARARRTEVARFLHHIVIGQRSDAQQFADERQTGFAGRAGEQPMMADAVEAARQDVGQEATDELVGGERHELLALGAATAVILLTEGDAVLIEPDEAVLQIVPRWV